MYSYKNAGIIQRYFIRKYFSVFDPEVSVYHFKQTSKVLDPYNNTILSTYTIILNEGRFKFLICNPNRPDMYSDNVSYIDGYLTLDYNLGRVVRVKAEYISESERDNIIHKEWLERESAKENALLAKVNDLINIKLNNTCLEYFEKLVRLTVDKYRNAFNLNKDNKLILVYSKYTVLYDDGIITYEAIEDNRPVGWDVKQLTIKYIESLDMYVKKINYDDDNHFFSKLKEVLSQHKPTTSTIDERI